MDTARWWRSYEDAARDDPGDRGWVCPHCGHPEFELVELDEPVSAGVEPGSGR